MGKWKRYAIGRYSLQQLHGVACAVWQENGKRRRFRLGVRTEPDGRAALARFAYVWIPSKGHPRNKVLSEAEFLKLLDSAGMPHVRLFMILCLATAGRKGAILELTWDRVDFEAGEIELKRPETLDPMSKAARKGRARVPMNRLARAALQEARQAALSDNVIEWNGEPVANVGKAFRAAVARAGLEGVTPHTIRHTAATWAWEATTPDKVARFLGHRNERTTAAIYAHPSAGFATDAARAVDLKVVRKT